MATPSQIRARVYAMRVIRIATQRAIKEKERLDGLSDEERKAERFAGLSPQEKYIEAAIEASNHFPKDLAIFSVIALLVWGLYEWLVV